MSKLAELNTRLHRLLDQLRTADAYESARLAKEVAALAKEMQRETVLAQKRVRER